jgi:hypothetical protein
MQISQSEVAHRFPLLVLMQPNAIGVPGNKFIDGQTLDQLRTRYLLLFAVDKNGHELLLSLAAGELWGDSFLAVCTRFLAFLFRVRHRSFHSSATSLPELTHDGRVFDFRIVGQDKGLAKDDRQRAIALEWQEDALGGGGRLLWDYA